MTKETHHAAVAAIQFALSNPEGMEFLRLWNEGEFDILRRDWPEAPDSVYIGADPLAQQPEAQAEEVERQAWELLEAECGKPLPFDVPTPAALSAIRAALTGEQ